MLDNVLMKDITIFSLFIDNQLFAIQNAIPFYQKYPFPGGHNYELIIETNKPKLIKNLINDRDFGDLSKIYWDTFFMGLTEFMGGYIEFSTRKYLLSNVEAIEISDNRLVLRGICSKYILENNGEKSIIAQN
jgi:hypothetical protein